MNAEERAAFVNAQSACAQIEAHGMVAENMQRKALGQPMAYDLNAFAAVITKYGIDHNSVVTFMRG